MTEHKVVSWGLEKPFMRLSNLGFLASMALVATLVPSLASAEEIVTQETLVQGLPSSLGAALIMEKRIGDERERSLIRQTQAIILASSRRAALQEREIKEGTTRGNQLELQLSSANSNLRVIQTELSALQVNMRRQQREFSGTIAALQKARNDLSAQVNELLSRDAENFAQLEAWRRAAIGNFSELSFEQRTLFQKFYDGERSVYPEIVRLENERDTRDQDVREQRRRFENVEDAKRKADFAYLNETRRDLGEATTEDLLRDWERVSTLDPNHFWALIRQASLNAELGKAELALSLSERAQFVASTEDDTVEALTQVARISHFNGNNGGRLSLQMDIVSRREAIYRRTQTSVSAKRFLAQSYKALASIYADYGDILNATKYYELNVELLQEMVSQSPQDAIALTNYRDGLLATSEFYCNFSQFDIAKQLRRTADGLTSSLMKEPSDTETSLERASSAFDNLGADFSCINQGNGAVPVRDRESSANALRAIASQDPSSQFLRLLISTSKMALPAASIEQNTDKPPKRNDLDLVSARSQLALHPRSLLAQSVLFAELVSSVSSAEDRLDDLLTLQLINEQSDLIRSILLSDPKSISYKIMLANTLLTQTACLRRLGDFAIANDLLTEVGLMIDEMKALVPRHLIANRLSGVILDERKQLAIETERLRDGIAFSDREIELYRSLVDANPTSRLGRWSLQSALASRGYLLASVGRQSESITFLTESVALIWQLSAENPNQNPGQREALIVERHIASIQEALGNGDLAKELFEKAVTIEQEIVATNQSTIVDKMFALDALVVLSDFHANSGQAPLINDKRDEILQILLEFERSLKHKSFREEQIDIFLGLAIRLSRYFSRFQLLRDFTEISLKRARDQMQQNPNSKPAILKFLTSLMNIAQDYSILGQKSRSEGLITEILSALQSFNKIKEADEGVQYLYSVALMNRAILSSQRGRKDEAQEYRQKSLLLARQISTSDTGLKANWKWLTSALNQVEGYTPGPRVTYQLNGLRLERYSVTSRAMKLSGYNLSTTSENGYALSTLAWWMPKKVGWGEVNRYWTKLKATGVWQPSLNASLEFSKRRAIQQASNRRGGKPQ
jgi:tetratricopeptide (TPR) repeat protein